MRARALFLTMVFLAAWGGPLRAAPPIPPEILQEIELKKIDDQEVLLISLKAVLKIAAERAPQLEVIANQVEAARRNRAANQGIEPVQWTSRVSQGRSTSPSTFLLTTGGSASDYLSVTGTNQQVASTGLSHQTKFGLSYGLTYQRSTSLTQLASIESAGEPVGAWTDYTDNIYSDALIAEAKLPLLKGFGEVNRVEERLSEINYETTRLNGKRNRRDLLGQVASVYWDLVGVHQAIVSLEQSLELARQFHQDNQTRYRLGALDATEVKLSETQLALAERDLLQAQIQRKAIEDQIRVILGLKDLDYAYLPTEEPQTPEVTQAQAELFERVLQESPEVALYQEQLRANRLDELQARDRDSAALDLSLQYQVNGYGLDSSTASGGLSDSGLDGYSVGLTFSMPLFDDRPKERLAQVQLERASLETQLSDAKDQLEVELGATLRNLKLAQRSINLARTSWELNGQLYQKEQARFKLGQSTSYRVDQVRQDLLEAELSLNQAKIQYEKTYLNLMLLTDQFEAHYEL